MIPATGHGIAEREWIERFAAKMCLEQPAVENHLAVTIAKVKLPTLGVLKPDDAVEAFLAVQLDRHNWAGDAALQALARIRHSL